MAWEMWKRVRVGLKQSAQALGEGIKGLWQRSELTSLPWAQRLEEIFIEADFGPALAQELAQVLTKQPEIFKTQEAFKHALEAYLVKRLAPLCVALPQQVTKKPWVLLVVGVNGGGKTTTIGKLASLWTEKGERCLVVPGDTFRAAAKDQLTVWVQRAGAHLFESSHQDPAALSIAGMLYAQQHGFDRVIIDTAGRLHTQQPLMDELKKIAHVLKRYEAPDATALVVDGTLGQAVLTQVDIFKQALSITGMILTKLDGTAQGGAIVATALKHNLPIYGIGLGEDREDFAEFDAATFAAQLVGREA